jgi:hypothetical protein
LPPAPTFHVNNGLIILKCSNTFIAFDGDMYSWLDLIDGRKTEHVHNYNCISIEGSWVIVSSLTETFTYHLADCIPLFVAISNSYQMLEILEILEMPEMPEISVAIG